MNEKSGVLLHWFGVNVADSILLRRGEQCDEDEIAERIGMPCFVKPAAGAHSWMGSQSGGSERPL